MITTLGGLLLATCILTTQPELRRLESAQPVPLNVAQPVALNVAQPVALNLGRKIKTTDKYLIVTSASFRLRIAIDAKGTPRTDSTFADSVRLQALCEVTSVTEAGEEYAKKLTVRYFQRFVKNVIIDVLPTGAVISATFDGANPTFTVDGKKPEPDVEEMLRLAVRSEGGTEAGEILNPPKPVSIGDTWSINKKAFAKSMAPGSAKPVTKGLNGKVRFAGIDTLNARPCATVVAAVREKKGSGTKQSPLQTNSYDITLSVPLDERYPTAASKVRACLRVESRAKGLTMLRETDVTIASTFER